MKKVFSVLAFASALALSACGGEKPVETTPETVVDTPMMPEIPIEEVDTTVHDTVATTGGTEVAPEAAPEAHPAH